MKYAYANVEYRNDYYREDSYDSGRFVATVDGQEFFISDEQSAELEGAGIYRFLIRFDPDDQFARIIHADEVAKMAERLESHPD